MDNFMPDMYKKSIYDIDYTKLLKQGIKCLLFDLDNTISPVGIKNPSDKVINLFEELKEMGFKIIIISNSNKKRLEPFKNTLNVDCAANSFKPFKRKYLKIIKEYCFEESEIATIGDQFLTDIWGGNKVGITTILVNPISKKDVIFTRLNRALEKIVMNKLAKKGLFKKGKYYG
jgi:uncharacterized protein